MAQDVYKRLAKHLDDLPGGFPATESGVELKILQKLFTPEQAELALGTTLIPEEARVIARRAGLSSEEAASRLDQMVQQGLILGIYPPQRAPLYMAAQYVIGIWEYNVNSLDQELVELMNQYVSTLFDPETWSQAPQLRTIPVGRSLDAGHQVMPYEEAAAIIAQQKKILVAPCICRKEHKMAGQGCDRLLEACLVFGAGAYLYERRGVGRVIDQAEALEILKKADEDGLVLQPSNSQKVINICCCCGCCCQVLLALKRHPRPASLVSSPFTLQVDTELCIGCEVCQERCQMDALSMENEHVLLDPERCLGCGLCVSTCPSGALTLARKPQDQQRPVPATFQEAVMDLARARGKMGATSLALMGLKSKLDRFLASKD
ncbi:MAG: 4Fe-4S dicluster domain-containing protein [Desulfarculus sp.]|jgi:ferredoxin|nr:MAG: 4Fe-4S dicluster domain-containing protein [Desulfarculus sp.]